MQSIRTPLHESRIAAAVAFTLLVIPVAGARANAQPSYPVYCRGPLSKTSASATWIWAAKPAKEAAPLPGQCAWPDRLPRAGEMMDAAEFGGPIGGPNYGVLCPLNARVQSELTQYPQDTYYSLQVESKPYEQSTSNCFDATEPPVLVTPETRPWPVVKNPSQVPRGPVH
jgi:hypothetical protein